MQLKKISIAYDSNNLIENLVNIITAQPEFEINKLFTIDDLKSENVGEFIQDDREIIVFYLENTTNLEFYDFFTSNFLIYKNKQYVLISNYVYVKMMNFLIVKGFRSFLGASFSREECLLVINCAFNDRIYIDSYHSKKTLKALQEINKFEIDTDISIIDFAVTHNLDHRASNIIALLNQGKTYDEIAFKLFISPDTVRFHIKKMYKAFNVHSKNELLSLVMKEFEIDK